MAKTIFKQIMLTLLVCVAVGLFLIIVFYNFIPANKAIPGKVGEYKTPESISKEMDSSIGGDDKNAVYEITSADITAYKNSNIYEPGKVDPFDDVIENTNVTTTNATSSTTVNTGDTTGTTTTTTTTRTNNGSTTSTTTRTTNNASNNSNTTSSSSTSTKTNTTKSNTEDNYYKASGISKGGK